jgi:hypothetical protein
MLLKRVETNGVVKAIYESSNILASKYNAGTNELTITFNHGGQYKYSDVSPNEYFKFEMADSQGKVFNSNIKSKKTDKLDNVDPKTILAEVESYRKDEIKMFEEGVIKEMRTIVNVYDVEGLNVKSLDNLVAMINRYKEALSTQTQEVNG